MRLSRLCAAATAAALMVSQALSPSAYAAVPQTLILQRALAQQGLAVGLATILLESQLQAFFGFLLPVNRCQSLAGGGAIKPITQKITATAFSGRVRVYFDATCTKLYLDEILSMTLVAGTTYAISATAQVYNKGGTKVGTLVVSKNTRISIPTPTTIRLVGNQIFQPAITGAAKVVLATSCELPRTASAPAQSARSMLADFAQPAAGNAITCSAAIAQDFALIGKATGSVTQVTLNILDSGKVTFTQAAPAKLVTGAIGALAVKVNAAGVVSIAGTQTQLGTTALAGQASQLALFPPKPVNWTVADKVHGVKFTIALLSDTTRALSGAIRTSANNAIIAPIALDQSGSGTIKYSNGLTAPITSWVLTK